MIKTLILTAIALAIALGGGIASAWYAIDGDRGFGTVTLDGWTAERDYGTPAADPYSRARFSRQPDLVLGSSEGLMFHARQDSGGEPLLPRCTYRISGTFPAARFWTLHLRSAEDEVLPSSGTGRRTAIHSRSLLRTGDGTASITIASQPSAGNWLAVTGEAPFSLVLSLYDTATASSARIQELRLPPVERVSCDG